MFRLRMECLVMKCFKLGQAVSFLCRKSMFAVQLVPELLETRPSCPDFRNAGFCW